MTVKNLISLLKKFKEDAEIQIVNEDFDNRDIDKIAADTEGIVVIYID